MSQQPGFSVARGVLALACAAMSCQAQLREESAPAEYFPLIADSSYQYSGLLDQHRFRVRLTVRRYSRGGIDFHYFDQGQYDYALKGNMFASGAFRMKGDRLEMVDARFKNFFEEIRESDFHFVMVLPPRSGERTDFDTRRARHRFEVLAYEDVTVPAGSFPRCVKLLHEELVTDAGDPYSFMRFSRDVIWLAQGVGVVKWSRGSGRVDELVAFHLPAPGKAAPR